MIFKREHSMQNPEMATPVKVVEPWVLGEAVLSDPDYEVLIRYLRERVEDAVHGESTPELRGRAAMIDQRITQLLTSVLQQPEERAGLPKDGRDIVRLYQVALQQIERERASMETER